LINPNSQVHTKHAPEGLFIFAIFAVTLGVIFSADVMATVYAIVNNKSP
jgi:hypothetical protein